MDQPISTIVFWWIRWDFRTDPKAFARTTSFVSSPWICKANFPGCSEVQSEVHSYCILHWNPWSLGSSAEKTAHQSKDHSANLEFWSVSFITMAWVRNRPRWAAHTPAAAAMSAVLRPSPGAVRPYMPCVHNVCNRPWPLRAGRWQRLARNPVKATRPLGTATAMWNVGIIWYHGALCTQVWMNSARTQYNPASHIWVLWLASAMTPSFQLHGCPGTGLSPASAFCWTLAHYRFQLWIPGNYRNVTECPIGLISNLATNKHLCEC